MNSFKIVFALIAVSGAVAQQTDADWQALQAADAAETRLADYRDSPEVLQMKFKLVDVINADRKKNKAGPLALDILASRVANKQSQEAAQNHYYGNWDLAGETPYARYGLAGGSDHVLENAAAERSNADFDPAKLYDYMVGAHQKFMAEKSPKDSNRQNVLNPVHTHVGLGAAVVGNEFRFSEEFLDRYFTTLEYPATVKAGEKFTIHAVPAAGYFCYVLVAFHDAFPQPMKAKAIDKRNSYNDFTKDNAATLWPDALNVADDGSISQALSFKKPGLYYVQIFVDKTKPQKTGQFTNKGKIPASGMIISVEK
jgi:uncharacterized protein YkwD